MLIFKHKMEFYSAPGKNKSMSYTRKWMVPEINMLTKISQSQRQACFVSYAEGNWGWGYKIKKVNFRDIERRERR